MAPTETVFTFLVILRTLAKHDMEGVSVVW